MNGVQQENTTYPRSRPTGPAQVPPPPGDGGIARKSPALATMLSALPGLGQVYVGYYQQGFINILVVGSLIAILNSNVRALEPLFGVFLAFFWIFNMIDANRRAIHYNRVAAGYGSEEIPDGFPIPGTGGSVAGGAVLIVVGVLLFLNSKFDVSMAWLEDWWPLALVAGGVWLIARTRRQEG